MRPDATSLVRLTATPQLDEKSPTWGGLMGPSTAASPRSREAIVWAPRLRVDCASLSGLRVSVCGGEAQPSCPPERRGVRAGPPRVRSRDQTIYPTRGSPRAAAFHGTLPRILAMASGTMTSSEALKQQETAISRYGMTI